MYPNKGELNEPTWNVGEINRVQQSTFHCRPHYVWSDNRATPCGIYHKWSKKFDLKKKKYPSVLSMKSFYTVFAELLNFIEARLYLCNINIYTAIFIRHIQKIEVKCQWLQFGVTLIWKVRFACPYWYSLLCSGEVCKPWTLQHSCGTM